MTAVVVILALSVGGIVVYNTLSAAPQLTSAQFDRLESVRTYGGQPATFRQSIAIGWSWFGADEGDLPACQKLADFDNDHLLSTYQATTNPSGGTDGSVMFRLFGNNSELSTYQRLWADCDAAAKAAKIEDAGGTVGSTAGVAWERYEETGVFWYGNVQVVAIKSFYSDAGMATEATALKAVIDSLR